MKVQFLKSHLIASTGYGEHARNHAAALVENSFDVTAINDHKGRLGLKGVRGARRMNDQVPVLYISGQHHLYVLPPNQAAVITTMIETDRLHPKWAEKLKKADAVWVPSRFNYETFLEAGLDAEKLRIVKAAVDCDAIDACNDVYPFSTKKRFKFLSIFNKITWYRKGLDVLLKAYYQTFSNKDDVCLILRADLSTAELHRLTGITPSLHAPEVEIINTYLNDGEMAGLYKGADAYVTASRGEGVGRPYLYAMLQQMPTIAVNWSGNTEFMTDENSFLVDFHLQDVPRDLERIVFPMNFGSRYAEPRLDDLADKMSYVFHHFEEAQKKGPAARETVISNHSYRTIAAQTLKALEQLTPPQSRPRRTLMPRDIFVNMHPLYFPGAAEALERLDQEFSAKRITGIAVYGTGAGSKSAYRWLTRFKHIKKIIFLDRNRDVKRCSNRKVYHYDDFEPQSVDLILIGTAPVFVPGILENLKKVSTVPIYMFGP